MSKQVAVLIGVARAGKLPELQGAINDVKKFGVWAEAQGYEIHLISDEGGPVTVDAVKGLIKRLVDPGDVERMLLYFAGHGIQPTVNTAYWLLSNWENDSDEAINVTLSLANAKRSGIAQIAVFADACRSTAPDAASVGGSSIFPKPQMGMAKQPQWDQFFASRLGESAQDVAGTDHSKSYGIFSKCVMTALGGEAERAIEHRAERVPPRAVTSDSLAAYLEGAVPDESGRTPGASVQLPDVVAGWRHPHDVYVGFPVRPAPDERNRLSGFFSREKETLATSYARAQDDARVDAATQVFAAGVGRQSFETRQGLTIIGARPVSVVVSKSTGADLFEENGAWHVRGHANAPQAALVRLEGDRWLATAIIPGFVGTIVVHKEVAASLTYTPAGSGRFIDDAPYAELTPLVHRWTALMQQGRSFKPDEFRKAADTLRRYKHSNPSLGVLAAYAYERAGDISEIDDIASHFASRGQAIPFDVAHLSRFVMTYGPRPSLKVPAAIRDTTEVAGSFPLMSQGWALLDPEDHGLHPDLFQIRSGLQPSLWTTLDDPRGQHLAALVEKGEL